VEIFYQEVDGLADGQLDGPSANVSDVGAAESVRQPRQLDHIHVLERAHCRRHCADTTGTVPVPWAGHPQCSNINIFFSKKIYESNFVKQHSETVMA